MSEDRTAAGGRDWNDPREVEDPEIDAQNKAFVSATRKLPLRRGQASRSTRDRRA